MEKIENLDQYQAEAIKTAIYPENMKIIYPLIGMFGEAGEVAEKIKKTFRDENGNLSDEKKELLKKELGDVMWYIAALSRDLGFTLSDIATLNIEKLRDRQNRGVIHGSGDTR